MKIIFQMILIAVVLIFFTLLGAYLIHVSDGKAELGLTSLLLGIFLAFVIAGFR